MSFYKEVSADRLLDRCLDLVKASKQVWCLLEFQCLFWKLFWALNMSLLLVFVTGKFGNQDCSATYLISSDRKGSHSVAVE